MTDTPTRVVSIAEAKWVLTTFDRGRLRRALEAGVAHGVSPEATEIPLAAIEQIASVRCAAHRGEPRGEVHRRLRHAASPCRQRSLGYRIFMEDALRLGVFDRRIPSIQALDRRRPWFNTASLERKLGTCAFEIRRHPRDPLDGRAAWCEAVAAKVRAFAYDPNAPVTLADWVDLDLVNDRRRDHEGWDWIDRPNLGRRAATAPGSRR